MPEKKDYVSLSKAIHKKTLQLAKVFITSENYILLSNKNTQNVNIGFSKFWVLKRKSCVLAASKMINSVWVCGAYQNVVLLVDSMDLDFTYKDLINLSFSGLKYFQ